MSDSLRPHGLYSPWNSPGQNTGVGSLSLLQGSFPGIEPRSPALAADSLPAEPQAVGMGSFKCPTEMLTFYSNRELADLVFQVGAPPAYI